VPSGDGLAATVQRGGEGEEEGAGSEAGLAFWAAASAARRLVRASLFFSCSAVGWFTVDSVRRSAFLGSAAFAGGLSAAAFVRAQPQHHWCSGRLCRRAEAAGQSAWQQSQPLDMPGGRQARLPPPAPSKATNSLNSLNCCARDGPEPHRVLILSASEQNLENRHNNTAAASSGGPTPGTRQAKRQPVVASAERRRKGGGSAPTSPRSSRASQAIAVRSREKKKRDDPGGRPA